MWEALTTWELFTPWGIFRIGVFDGFLLWMLLVSVGAVVGGIRQTNNVDTRRRFNKE